MQPLDLVLMVFGDEDGSGTAVGVRALVPCSGRAEVKQAILVHVLFLAIRSRRSAFRESMASRAEDCMYLL
jgi:hypothetical protein